MSYKVGINGFGRIGKGIFRVNDLDKNTNKGFEVVVIKDVHSIENIAYLLKYDSLYGTYCKSVEIDGDHLVINGDSRIRYFRENNICAVPWSDYGLDLIIESSGFSKIKELRDLLDNNVVKNIVCTWNNAQADITIVCGINVAQYNKQSHSLISASTCTGNGVVPIMHILDEEIGIELGHIVTIHPVLSDQKLMDSAHKDFHLGRMATSSIIPTETSVVKSTLILHPSLEGKLDCISYRVPTNLVSSIDISILLKKDTTLKAVKDLFKKYEANKLKGIINCDYGFLEHNKVSIDFIRSPYSCIILMKHIQLTKNRFLSLSVFHDNEWGYSRRVCDLIDHIVKH